MSEIEKCKECGNKEIYQDNLCFKCFGEQLFSGLGEKDKEQQEIESLNESITWWSNRFNAVERDNRELRKEIERLHSIIKEVREHIEKTIEYEKGCGFNRWTYEDGQETYIDMVEKTLDILDKGDKENI